VNLIQSSGPGYGVLRRRRPFKSLGRIWK